MTTQTKKIVAFTAALWLLAAAIFVNALPLPASAGWVDLLLFFVLAALAEGWYVSISKESGMSLSFTVHFAAAILFGPAAAMLIAAVGLVVTDGLVRRTPPLRLSFNTAQMVMSVGLCALVYQALAVNGPVNLVADAPALALSALVYLLVNDSLVAGVLSLSGRSFFQEWRLSAKDILLPYASMAPLGALAAYTYQSSAWALLYFLPLVLVVYDGFKLFVSLRYETDDALLALADSVDRRDKYTYEHSMRVAALVEKVAVTMGLQPRERDLIVVAARVHDLGKIATDNLVLHKPSALTPEERRSIENHSAEGEELAGRFSMFRKGRLLIRHHHERWDGTGYPDGLAGTQVPLGARIIAVADAYDAMTSDRPHRKALPPDVAVKELRHCAGTQFDPQIVQAMIESLDGDFEAEALLPQPQSWPPEDVVAGLTDGRDPAQLWAAGCLSLSRMLDVPDCDIHRLDASGAPVCVASVREGKWDPDFAARRVNTTLWAVEREALRTRRPVLVAPHDRRLKDGESDEMVRRHERSRAILPLIVRDQVIGLVEASETRDGREVSQTQLAAAEPMCQLVAVAVHNAEAIDDQRLQSRRLATMLESSRAVASAKSVEDALTIVARRAVEQFDITSCIAYEYDQEHDAIVPRGLWEREPSGWSRVGEPLHLDALTVERDLLATGGLRLECVSDPQLDPASRATMLAWGEKSCLTVPMQSVDGPMGLLTFWDSARERHYTDDEVALAVSLAELAAETVRGAKLLRRLQGLSETDSLTGLANRRKIHEFLEMVQAQAGRYGSQFSVVMLDIDGFKSLNDTHGHLAGDAVLRGVSAVLKSQTRASDIVGRYGGDEFLLILPETARGEALVLAENLREALSETPCTTPSGENVHVRASLGVAGYAEDGPGIDELIAAADASLYASKRLGGDAVTDRKRPAEAEDLSLAV